MMQKTTYRIGKMDCASEEQLVRMKLDDLTGINHLSFDLKNRTVEVHHSGTTDTITTALDELKLDSQLLDSVTDFDGNPISDDAKQRRLLWIVLAINLSLFVIEIVTGFISNSMGLVADSLDMLADALVYGLALWAVGSTLIRKKRIAKISGYFQLTLAVLGLVEVIRRFYGVGEVPVFQMMIYISVLALTGNGISLYLLQRSQSREAHMQASMIFTSNDVIVNLGVIVAGVLVYFTDSKIPDLIVGICVFLIVGRGALRILKL